MKLAYLNKMICFTSSETNTFNILGYFDKTISNKSYDKMLKILKESISCKIKII